jgi:uncharacterized protein YbjT (DUF2867 family)
VDLAQADLGDADALAKAFEGARGAYVLNPPAYTAPDLFATADALADAIARAVRSSGLGRLVVLSSLGAHLPDGTGNILTNHAFEERLGDLDASVTFVRPGYFMQNWGAVAAVAAKDGVLPSFLAPLDRAIPMVSAADIGRVAAEALLEPADAAHIIELDGPRASSPNDAAAAFAKVLGRPVAAVAVPESQWPAILRQNGFSDRTIEAWVEMFRGFNDGSINFEGAGTSLRGQVPLDQAITTMLADSRPR